MAWKSILKPEGSVMGGLATVGAVYGVYNINLGSVAAAQATEANHPVLNTSRSKAGYISLALVSSLVLITRDANIGILGGATIVAMELSYRHATMASPLTGAMVAPSESSYQPVPNNVTPMTQPDTNTGYETEYAG
jgi:hypothetical protein